MSSEAAALEHHYFFRRVAELQGNLLPVEQLTEPVLAEAVHLSIRFREHGGRDQWHTFVVAEVGSRPHAVSIGYGYAHDSELLRQKYGIVGGEFFITPRTD